MIIDLQTLFSGTVAADGTKTGQAVNTGTQISTNVLDLRNAATPTLVDEGIYGQELWLVVQVLVAFATAAAGTLDVTLESDVLATLASAPVVHAKLGAAALVSATLVAGYTIFRGPLPSADYKRFLGLRYTVGSTFSAGTTTAYLTPDIQRNVIYPTGFVVG
jgi:hypothetical protein